MGRWEARRKSERVWWSNVALADRRLFPGSARTVICRISVKSFMLFLLQVLQLFRLSSG